MLKTFNFYYQKRFSNITTLCIPMNICILIQMVILSLFLIFFFTFLIMSQTKPCTWARVVVGVSSVKFLSCACKYQTVLPFSNIGSLKFALT